MSAQDMGGLAPSRAVLRDAILEVRGVYLARMSLHAIGDGACFNFADDVMDLVFGETWRHRENRHGWGTLVSDQLYLPPEGSDDTSGAVAWDWAMLGTQWGIFAPESDRARHDAIVIRDPSHCWIHLDGLHHDCENPDGVASFFDLAFFRRWLA